jgi:hypothetical protein
MFVKLRSQKSFLDSLDLAVINRRVGSGPLFIPDNSFFRKFSERVFSHS